MKAWLESLEMEGYTKLFAACGYKERMHDLGSLKSLKADDFSVFKKGNSELFYFNVIR